MNETPFAIHLFANSKLYRKVPEPNYCKDKNQKKKSFVVQCVYKLMMDYQNERQNYTNTQAIISHYLFIHFSNMKKRLSQFVFQVFKRGNRSMCVSSCSLAISSSCILHFRCVCVLDMFRWMIV